jgi:hypothetical protein
VKQRKVGGRGFSVSAYLKSFSTSSESLTPENNRFARTVVIPSAPAAKGTALTMSLLSCKQARKDKKVARRNKNHRRNTTEIEI